MREPRPALEHVKLKECVVRVRVRGGGVSFVVGSGVLAFRVGGVRVGCRWCRHEAGCGRNGRRGGGPAHTPSRHHRAQQAQRRKPPV
ncbi:hypothetical protein K439DRAFT_1642083, partial [Ramaria rubella]